MSKPTKTIKTINSEQLATKFHETYERLAPDFGYETREDTKQFDPQSKNGKLMIAVCKEILQDIKSIIESEVIGKDERHQFWCSGGEENCECNATPLNCLRNEQRTNLNKLLG